MTFFISVEVLTQEATVLSLLNHSVVIMYFYSRLLVAVCLDSLPDQLVNYQSIGSFKNSLKNIDLSKHLIISC